MVRDQEATAHQRTSAPARKLNDPHANAQEMRRPETNLGCGQAPGNPNNQEMSVPCSIMIATAKASNISGEHAESENETTPEVHSTKQRNPWKWIKVIALDLPPINEPDDVTPVCGPGSR